MVTKVLKIAQSLYEKKVTTYPRTASRYLDDSQKDIAGRSLDAVKGMFPDINISFKDSNNIFNSAKVDSHPALMPTYITPKDGDLSPDENIVYSEIVKRFCALFAPEAEYLQTEAFIEINGYKFRIKGKVLTSPGWKQIYGTAALKDEDDDLESELKLQLKENMLVTNIGSDSISKETKPPSHYTIQGLLDAMQNCGKSVPVDDIELFSGYQIGSPNGSSRADILSKIEKVGYVQLKGKSYRITKMGIDLIELFPIREMLEPSFTGRLEKQLKDIELGSFSQDDFMTIVKDIVSNGIEEMKGTKGHIGKDILSLGKCPECGKDIVESEKGYGCIGYKEGCKFSIFKENALLKKYDIKSVPKTLIKALLANSLEGSVKLGNRTIPVKIAKSDERWGLKFEFEESSLVSVGTCPICHKEVIETEKGFGCSGYKEGCKFFISNNNPLLLKFGVKSVPKTLIKNLLSNSLKSNVKLGNKNVDVSLEKNNDNDFWSLKFNFDKVSVISLGKCPECGKDVVESEKGYGCSGYKEGCKFSLWKDDLILKKYGKKLSVSMVKEFLAKKQCSVKGLVDPKNGAVFDATINFAKNEKGYWGYKIFKV